jgi:hypothetical protein
VAKDEEKKGQLIERAKLQIKHQNETIQQMVNALIGHVSYAMC